MKSANILSLPNVLKHFSMALNALPSGLINQILRIARNTINGLSLQFCFCKRLANSELKTKQTSDYVLTNQICLSVSNTRENIRNVGFFSGVRIHVTSRILEKSNAFHLLPPYNCLLLAFLETQR